MALTVFLFEAVGISLSGVMSPGPMTAATVAEGANRPSAGAYIALGHLVVELPIMLLIFSGAEFLKDNIVRVFVGFCGGVFLLFLSYSFLKTSVSEAQTSRRIHPFLSGILLSAANPYFLVWWATVGAALIFRSLDYGFVGFLLFAILHWLCDLVWYWFLSAAAYKGKDIMGGGFYKGINVLCGLFLLVMGIKFIRDALLTYGLLRL